MKNPIFISIAQAALSLTFLVAFPSTALAYSPNPDLTAAGAIAAPKVDPNASRLYTETYNLGPTGLRGWIYIDGNNTGLQGLITAPSRQILVTVPAFTSDCRKALGMAIGNAEKTGAGTL